jgi:multicomponent Na+:H+ antiporter subunit F
MELMSWFSFIFQVSLVIAGTSSLMRIWKGPSDLDRIVALEYLGAISIAFIAWYSWETQQKVFMDVAIAMAALGFIGTVAFSRSLIKKGI